MSGFFEMISGPALSSLATAVAERAPTLPLPRKREREEKQHDLPAGKQPS
jgi:hypothetical protein